MSKKKKNIKGDRIQKILKKIRKDGSGFHDEAAAVEACEGITKFLSFYYPETIKTMLAQSSEKKKMKYMTAMFQDVFMEMLTDGELDFPEFQYHTLFNLEKRSQEDLLVQIGETPPEVIQQTKELADSMSGKDKKKGKKKK